MTEKEIESYLEKAGESGIRPGLGRMFELCKRLGNPQDEYGAIHVAGTNGKGSTSAYIASILLHAGIKFGWYSSPAVIDERETIRVMDGAGGAATDGQAGDSADALVGIQDTVSAGERGDSVIFRDALVSSSVRGESYVQAMTEVIEAAEGMRAEGLEAPTRYEIETAGAFVCFRNEEVKLAIIEVGMGGRGDATNVIKKSLVSVITPIGLDHMQFLGSSISQIAGEKAGIIPEGGHVVTDQPGLMLSAATDRRTLKRLERNRGMILGRIRSEAEEKQASMTLVDREQLEIKQMSLEGTDFTYRGVDYHTSMLGTYQPGNAALAIEAVQVINELMSGDGVGMECGNPSVPEEVGKNDRDSITREDIIVGVSDAVWPGRCDIVSENPLTIYDGAHNPDGAMQLALSLKRLIGERRVYALMGVYKDKDADDMLQEVLPYVDRLTTVRAPGKIAGVALSSSSGQVSADRGLSAASLAALARRLSPSMPIDIGGDDIVAAYHKVREQALVDGAVVLVFGSLSLARDIYADDVKSGSTEKSCIDSLETLDEKAGHDAVKAEGQGSITLLDILQKQGRDITALCGGQGRCGKCAVKVVEGSLPVTVADEKVFSKERLDEGWRLACRAVLPENAIVKNRFSGDEGTDVSTDGMIEVEIPAEHVNGMQDDDVLTGINGSKGVSGKYGIAIDIGTTTVAAALVRMDGGAVADTRTSINPQRRYGADVVTRIQGCMDGKFDEMHIAICEAVLSEIETLLVRNGLGYGQLLRVSIAANTTMLHILRGYRVDGLASYPFNPYNTNLERLTLGELAGDLPGWTLEAGLDRVPAVILPGVSAYVGADIVSGLYALDMDKNDKISALIDLGTNGELVLGNRNRMIATSTAAGPALEGGHIRFGTAAIRGAIAGVRIDGKQTQFATIGNMPPVGICGSGVIDMMAELVRNGIVDNTGLLSEDYFETGFPLTKGTRGEGIVFTQDDIREVQMAKAAIRAGFDLLLKEYGIGSGDVDKLYLAGGFGTHLDKRSAAIIGLIPDELLEKTQTPGNTSLLGAVRALTDEDFFTRITDVVSATKVIDLADTDEFQERYLAEMGFNI